MENLKIRNTKISTPLMNIIKDVKGSIINGKLSTIKPMGNNIRVTCVNPNHKGGHEAKASADIYVGNSTDRVNYGTYSCFTCQTSCSFTHFIAMAFDKDDVWAEKWLIDNYSDGTIEEELIDLPDIDLKRGSNKQPSLSESILDTFESFHPYMIQRKLTKRIIELFKIKYDANTESLVFPIYDEYNRLVMLTRRSVEGKRFIIDKNRQKPLYLLNYVLEHNIEKVIICEGQIDALTACVYGFPAIATIGAISEHQINLLNKSCIRILYLFFDNDESGRKFKETLISKLRKDILLIDVDISKTGKKDINDLNETEFWDCIQESENRF